MSGESRSSVGGVAVGSAPYPAELARALTLPDGATVRIRPITPEDEPRLAVLYGRLSRQTAYQRFFTVLERLPPDWYRAFANVDYRRRLALVVERDTTGGVELLGVARYEPAEEGGTAEVAFVIQDGWQGRGLGAALLGDLLRAAERRGVRRFQAYVLADNWRMLRLLTSRVAVLDRTLEDGVVRLTFAGRGGADGGPRSHRA